MTGFQYDVIAAAIDYLAEHEYDAPDLDALAGRFGYESTHFQKLFKDHVGISPKRMMQYMNYNRAREFLLEGYPTLEAAHAAGLSGSGRLHDLFVTIEAATPGMVQRRGEGMGISYGYHTSPVGELLIAKTDVGVCWLGFVVGGDRTVPFQEMLRHWPKATFVQDDDATREAVDHILRIWRGQGNNDGKLKLDLHGTNFQIQVWRALLRIPTGCVVSYHDIAVALGDAKASRAVGTAVGSNPVSLLIPCHRVIQKSGIVENYLWGTPRKKMILGIESSRCGNSVTSLFDE